MNVHVSGTVPIKGVVYSQVMLDYMSIVSCVLISAVAMGGV